MKRFTPKYNENYRMVFSKEEGLEDDFCVIFIDENSLFHGAAIHFDDMASNKETNVKFSVLKNPKEDCNPDDFKHAVKEIFIDIIENIAPQTQSMIITQDQNISVPDNEGIAVPDKKIIH